MADENKVSREEAQGRKLQGEHSTHHTASGVPDRDVKTHSSEVAAGTNPSPKTDLSTGKGQGPDPRDTTYPNSVSATTGQQEQQSQPEEGGDGPEGQAIDE